MTIAHKGSGDEFKYPVDAKRYILFVFDEDADLASGDFDFSLEASDEVRNGTDEEHRQMGRAITGVVREYMGYSEAQDVLRSLFGGE